MQTYLNTLYKRSEIILEDKTLMRPSFVQVGCADALPKIHKGVPSFCPIVDTTSTSHCGIAKFLSSLLSSLARNSYSVKD